MRKPLIGKRELLGGLVTGSATAFGSAVILLLLGLIPSQPLRMFFGTWFRHPVSGWVADAFLSPFWGLTTRREVYPGLVDSPTWHIVGAASFGALLVFVAVFCLIGIGVRWRVEGSRQRASTLVVAALSVAVIVAVAAAILAHTVPGSDSGSLMSPESHTTYSLLAFFFGALALTLLVGVFCFGLAGMLRQPWRAALRRAGAFVGICFVVFGLLFPAFVVSDNLPTASILDDFGHTGEFSAAVGGLAIPLALQAPVSLTQWWNSPWININVNNSTSDAYSYNPNSDSYPAHWMKLAVSTTMEHPHGRLLQHAASLGVVGSLVGAAISVAMVCALVLVSIGLCRSAGARRMRRGLEIGILQGGSIACLLAAVLWLSNYAFGTKGMMDYWGVTVFGAVQIVVTLILVCGLSGLVYGAKQARRDGRLTEGPGVQTPD
jgi:hypothetical protein